MAINKPFYKNRPIRSIGALAGTLSFPETLLRKLAARRDEFYIPGPKQLKSDGSPRITWKAKPPLEQVHESIKVRLLRNVEYPQYLQGSLPNRSALSNARTHSGARILTREDISAFFDTITEEQVYRIWRECFHFSEDVSRLLSVLTTKGGFLPQGAKTSSYLANLVLPGEPHLVMRLNALGFRVTRYVDDFSLSSRRFTQKSVQAEAIRQVYGLLRHEGFEPKRLKHCVTSSREAMMTTGYQVNGLPSLAKRMRAKLRAAVFQLERSNVTPTETQFRSVSTRVGRLATLGTRKGRLLQTRLVALRKLRVTGSA